MHIYITNLKTSEERKLFMEKQLKKLQVEYEFFDCVVGAELTEKEINDKCDTAAIKKHNEKIEWFNKGMIGCTMTNQNVYQDIINKNRPYALFLEDDTILPKNLRELLDSMEGFIKQGDVILLFWNSWNPLELQSSTVEKFSGSAFYRPQNYKDLTCGSAYIVTKQAAKKMIGANTPIQTTPDSWGFFYESGCIDRLFCAYPHVIQTADKTSTMQTGNFLQLRTIIDKYKIFPFYQYLRYRRRKLKQKSHQIVFT
jgi:GR25 family glycosyltransferase involved in LPS biosynthesis